MKFTLALIAVCSALVSAFTFPEGLENGNSRVRLTDDGQEIHEQSTGNDTWEHASTLQARSEPEEFNSRFMRRQLNEVYCGCNNILDHGQCDAATAAFRAQIANSPSIPWRQAFYSINGHVVVFACNYGNNNYGANKGAVITEDSFAAGLGNIDGACGRYVAGTSMNYIPNFPFKRGNGQDPWIGHSQYLAGDDFCKGALTSSSHSC